MKNISTIIVTVFILSLLSWLTGIVETKYFGMYIIVSVMLTGIISLILLVAHINTKKRNKNNLTYYKMSTDVRIILRRHNKPVNIISLNKKLNYDLMDLVKVLKKMAMNGELVNGDDFQNIKLK